MRLNADGYEADSENSEKSLQPAPKDRGKSNLVEVQEREIFQSNRRDESDENDSILDENIMHTDSCQWKKFSKFEDIISDSSDSDWLP